MEWRLLSSEQQQQKLSTLTEAGEDVLSAEVHRFSRNREEWVEFHVDFLGGKSSQEYDELRNELGDEGGSYSVRFDKARGVKCKLSHDSAMCKYHQKLHHIGQDESIYKAYAQEGEEWVIRGVRGLRKKTEGLGEMISAFQDECRGFGLRRSEEELAKVNHFWQTKKRPPVESSPGLRFLLYGKHRDGSWGYYDFEKQVADVMDCHDALYPDHRLMIDIDHSSDHAKYRDDALHVGHMNVKYGGKQRFYGIRNSPKGV